MDDTIRYCNMDLDIVSVEEMSPLIEALKPHGISTDKVSQGDDGLWYALFNTDNDYSEPEETIKHMISAIEMLSDKSLFVWSNCKLREFNIGYECGMEPWAFNQGVSNQLLSRISKAGASMRITLYPPVNDDSIRLTPVNMDCISRSFAKHFGLKEFRSGGQILRDERGWRTDEVMISRCWHVRVLPSFDDDISITTMHYSEHEFRGKLHSQQILICITMSNDSIVIGPLEIQNDPVAAAFQNMKMFYDSNMITLDGIRYNIWLENNQVTSSLAISNPTEHSLIAFESALFEITSTVQNISGNNELGTYLNKWKKYLSRG